MTTQSTGPGSTFDPSTATPSRTYASLRGAPNDALAADREAVAELRNAIEKVDEVVRENAEALVRAVRYLASVGYDQFADLGGGRPLQGLDARKLPDLAAVAAQERPGMRWLLIDSDITAITAGRAILRGIAETEQVDLRDPTKVLKALDVHLDLNRPVIVILGAVLHFLTDWEATQLMTALWGDLPTGSMVLVTHVTSTGVEPEMVARGKASYEARHSIRIYPRTEEEITGLAGRFVIREPGVVATVDFMPSLDELAPKEAPHFLMWMAERLPD
ncbi:SAM-dependent methyltransferase [Nonomuraea helvata]|uniref:SAM-dependent methyltransferase n=1 Tax=Nonomuraea helvata TaxID=37484 RepID=A0ABV5SJM7_9ACTN